MTKLYLYVCRYLTVLLLCGATTAFAQSTVTGKVTSSDDGSALPGVNILEKGTSNGTVSDSDGNFTITVGANATLILSFVGFTSQEVAVGSQTSLDIKLVSDVKALSEVVVVGYGSQEKKEITGAVVSLDTKDFNKGLVNDPTQLLQGKVAGLSIYNKGGDPNASAVIRLRGLSTVGSNLSPLVVVDGVLGASLDNIDPNDIATINVLKDGSAAAIYGSRGSSGVILVTTKRGSKKGGGIGVTFNSSVSSASVYKKIPVMGIDEYVANGGNDLRPSSGEPAAGDWQKLVTQNAVSTVQNLGLSGGNETTTFRLSTNLRNVNGILKKSGWDQINTRANLTHSALNNRLKFDINMSFTTRNSNFSFPDALRYAALFNPTAPVRNSSGDYYQAILFDNFNPVAIIDQNTNVGLRKNLNYSAKVDYNIINPLTLTLNFGRQYNDVNNTEYYPSTSLFRGYNRHGDARRYISDQNFTLFETYATYAKSINKIDLTVSGGYSYQEDQFRDLFLELGNFPSDALMANQLQQSANLATGLPGANGTNGVTSSATPVNKIIAFFGRVNLQFDKGIYFNASVRREGSTKLGKSNQWGTFPAIGAGVDINKYLQMASISQLKLRLGYGVTGSLPGPSGLSQDQYSYSFNGGGAVAFATNGNPNLKWEQKTEINAGLDFGFFNGKLTGSLDVYNRTISDFILLRNVPTTQYASGQQYQNAGSLNTPGFEITLNYNQIEFGELKWIPGIVLSHYATTLKDFVIPVQTRADFGSPGQNGTNIVRVAVGEKIGQIWGPVFDHVSAGGSDGAAQDPAGVGIAKGAPIFKDVNGDGKIDANPGDALNSKGDFKTLGNGIPSVEIGWSNRLTYKNWDFNVFFRAALGHSLVNQFRGFYEPIDPGAINSYNRVTTHLAPAGLQQAQYSSLYVEKADFVKLDNATIGYNFKLPASGAVKSVRVFVSGQNLFQVTKYTGIDPEPVLQDYGAPSNGDYPSTTPDVLAPGIDRRSNYFTARTFTFGLNFGF